MIQQQTQFLDIYRAGMRSAADAAKASLETMERMQNRQLQLVRSALEENSKSATELSQVKSLDELMTLQTRLAGSQLERWMEFWGGMWRVAGDNQTAIIGQLQSQAEQMRERFRETYDLTARTTESVARMAASQAQNTSAGVREMAKEASPERRPSERKSA